SPKRQRRFSPSNWKDDSGMNLRSEREAAAPRNSLRRGCPENSPSRGFAMQLVSLLPILRRPTGKGETRFTDSSGTTKVLGRVTWRKLAGHGNLVTDRSNPNGWHSVCLEVSRLPEALPVCPTNVNREQKRRRARPRSSA